MPAYAYAINVNYNRETVNVGRSARVPCNGLTVAKLADIVGDAVFSIRDEDEQFPTAYVVSWVVTRNETDEEMQARIKRGEAYNKKRESLIASGQIKPKRTAK